MFSWLKRKAPSTPRPRVHEPIYHWSDDEIPRYPPFMKGLPAVPPDRLLSTQSELLERIAGTAIATPQIFARFYVPAIERFASFAHLLPASQSHHHRGAGGLLRHSIEVGLWALQSADKVLLDAAKTPSQRREMEPRWQLAVFLAALCHDAGKPVTDLIVTDRDRTAIWKPIKEDLYAWATRSGIDAYFLDWREGRSRQHTALANLIADRIIGTDALEWIEEGGTELIVWLLESLNGNPGPTNLVYDLVVKADQSSVERDLKTLGVAMAGYDLGVPVERHLTDVMRRFVKEGIWLVNQPGARLWNIGGNLYLVWPSAGEEIARQVREDGIPGIPRTPDGILDMLVERQIAFVREGTTPGDRCWKIAPTVLAEKIPDIKLPAIRLMDEAMVSSVPIPPIEGRVVDDGEDSPQTPTRGESPPAADRQRDLRMSSEADVVQEQAPPAQPHLGPGAPRKTSAIVLDGAVGEALKVLGQDLKSGDKRWGEDAELDTGQQLLLRWPEAFSGYGLTAKGILDELTRREWLWIDPMAPLKKVLDAEIGGRPVKAIRLERAISQVLIRETGAIAEAKGSRGRVPSESTLADKTGQERMAAGPRLGHGTDGGDPMPEPGQTRSPKPAGRSSRPEEATDSGPSTQHDANSSGHSPGANPGDTGPERRKGMSQTATQPSLNEILEVLNGVLGTAVADGWRTLPKSEALTACRKRGLRVTHGWLAKLGQEEPGRFAVDGVVVRYRR